MVESEVLGVEIRPRAPYGQAWRPDEELYAEAPPEPWEIHPHGAATLRVR